MRLGETTMNKDQLAEIAKAMVTGGKGILAADESSGTIKKRFDAIGSNRRRRTGATIANSCSARWMR
jgi:fructose-bisphosphate aldolase class 1